jgi:hypothetical protein
MSIKKNSVLRSITGGALMVLLFAACGTPQASDALRALNDPDEVVGFLDFTNGTDKTFGIFVCSSATEVTLDSVEAINLDGEIELLGGLVYEANDGYVGAVDGFPPTGLSEDTVTGVEGAVVSTICDDPDPTLRTQLLVGANRVGAAGGTIQGIRIIHDDGFLEIPDYTIILCGDDLEYCEQYAPQT